MIRFFRVFPETLQGLIEAITAVGTLLAGVLEALHQHGSVANRVAALEQAQSVWQAEVEARLIKADSVLKAARAAEERTRVLANKARDAEGAEGGGDEGEEAVRRFLEAVQAGHAAGSEAEGVQPLRSGVAARPGKAASRAAKWGVNHHG